ncbi:FHA domain containing protein [Pirellula staleyi DSM 6068]|uniref:FHA domain containing protein n=1 Tax=Pirellula staleyi (strain ATCC 27377 / DSM 6068 / ICPB 4128) TaxID=530564 RepID=D2QXB5_PIRSD|nr:FHA domain containing protein [Pirellula staleyi DSM 6068]
MYRRNEKNCQKAIDIGACRYRITLRGKTASLPLFSLPPPAEQFAAPALSFGSPTVIVKLVCQDPLASPRELTLDRFPIEIGRSTTASVRIDDRWISRRHCQIHLHDGQLSVRDLGSRHGTFVNGKPVSESAVQHGDELCVGLTHFVVQFVTDRVALHESDSALMPVA